MTASKWSISQVQSLLGTKLWVIAGLVAYVLLAGLIEILMGEVQTVGALVAGGLACVPGALWLWLFSMRDREAAHTSYIAGMFALGVFVAGPLADFIRYQLVPTVPLAAHGLSPFALDRVLLAVLVVGLSQEICKYTIVRYTVYTAPEFDSPLDGVIYMMAVGTGFAAWLNYRSFTADHVSFSLMRGAADAVVTTLAHASFAGFLGYVLGRGKFSRRSSLVRGALVLLGLLMAATLNGLFAVLVQALRQGGAGTWGSVGYAGLVALAVFMMLGLFSRRVKRQAQSEGAA